MFIGVTDSCQARIQNKADKMPLKEIDPKQIEKFEKDLLAQVPDAGVIGNTRLLRQLSEADKNWTEDLFWAVRNRLIDERGELERGRGKGGSVRRVKKVEAVQEARPAQAAAIPAIQRERGLYDSMAKVIKENWSPDSGLREVIVEITAQGGRRPDGKWSRPDVTVASYKAYRRRARPERTRLVYHHHRPLGGAACWRVCSFPCRRYRFHRLRQSCHCRRLG